MLSSFVSFTSTPSRRPSMPTARIPSELFIMPAILIFPARIMFARSSSSFLRASLRSPSSKNCSSSILSMTASRLSSHAFPFCLSISACLAASTFASCASCSSRWASSSYSWACCSATVCAASCRTSVRTSSVFLVSSSCACSTSSWAFWTLSSSCWTTVSAPRS